jgi:hypothetical protein
MKLCPVDSVEDSVRSSNATVEGLLYPGNGSQVFESYAYLDVIFC